MPTKAELSAEVAAIEEQHIEPGKWVRFESASSGGRAPAIREGVVTYVDCEASDPHKVPVIVYESTNAAGERKEHRNRPSKLTVIKKPRCG
jgi:hypothetical protein